MAVTTKRPLEGLRVLDFSSMMAGPYCARWLADLGADVIKIESPAGDYMRSRPPLRNGHSAYFGHLNCGKRSVILDLKQPQAVALARRMVAESDVLIENYRPGVMARLGLDYESLRTLCPRLVYCSVSGYGQLGPDADKPAYAAIVHASSGFDTAWQAAQPAAEEPPTCGIQIADVVAASFSVMAIQSALLARAVNGIGQQIDLSLAEGMLALMPLEIVQTQFPDESRRTAYRPIPALEGHFVVMPLSQPNFLDLCTAMNRMDLTTDPRFAQPRARVDNWEALLAEIGAWAAQRSASDCVAHLERFGVPASSYKTLAHALTDPHLVSRGFLSPAQDGGGEFLVAGLPFSLSHNATRPDGTTRVPGLGEHTFEVLHELLDLSPVELQSLTDDGVLGAAGRQPQRV